MSASICRTCEAPVEGGDLCATCLGEVAREGVTVPPWQSETFLAEIAKLRAFAAWIGWHAVGGDTIEDILEDPLAYETEWRHYVGQPHDEGACVGCTAVGECAGRRRGACRGCAAQIRRFRRAGRLCPLCAREGKVSVRTPDGICGAGNRAHDRDAQASEGAC